MKSAKRDTIERTSLRKMMRYLVRKKGVFFFFYVHSTAISYEHVIILHVNKYYIGIYLGVIVQVLNDRKKKSSDGSHPPALERHNRIWCSTEWRKLPSVFYLDATYWVKVSTLRRRNRADLVVCRVIIK